MATLKIDGIEVEGTPEELAAMVGLMRVKPKEVAPPPPPPAPSAPPPPPPAPPPKIMRRTIKHTRGAPATEQKKIPYTKFRPLSTTEDAWSQAILDCIKNGGWYRLSNFLELLKIDKHDCATIYRVRSVLHHMQIGGLVVARRSSKFTATPIDYASPEEDQTGNHTGIRVWKVISR